MLQQAGQGLEENYGMYKPLYYNGVQDVYTGDINSLTIRQHFLCLDAILCDGIETDWVQNMMLNVTFVDGVQIRLSIFDYYMNIMFWALALNAGEQIDSMKLFFPDDITKKYIKRYIDNVFLRKYRTKLSFKKLNNTIDDAFVLFRYLMNYQLYLMNTLCLEDMIDLMNEYPEFEKTMHWNPSEEGVPFDDIINEGLKVQKIQKKYIMESDHHCFKDQFRTGEIISDKQYKEVFVNKGTAPAGDGKVYPVPINTSFVNGGLDTPESIVIESGVGRIAKILEKQNVGTSGAFARVLGLNNKDTRFHPDENYSCNTKHFMKVTIEDEEMLKKYDMRYYRTNPMGIDHLVDAQTDKDLIGQTLYFRSPMTCASYAAGHGLCRKCYGELYMVNRDINPGKIAAELLSSIFTQKMLSAKHLLESLVIKLKWNPEFFELFDVNFNSIQLLEGFDYTGYKLTITLPLDREEDPDDENYEFYTTSFTVTTPDGRMIQMGTEKMDNIYIHTDLLEGIDTDDDSIGTVDFDMDKLAELPVLFQIVVANEDLSHTMEVIKKMLNTKKFLIPDKDEMLNAFLFACKEGQGNIGINAVHFETILANQIRRKDDWNEMPQWEFENAPYDIITLNDSLLNNPSVTVRLEYNYLAKVLINPSSYTAHKANDYDLYFMIKPQEFLKGDGIISAENGMIEENDDVLQSPFTPIEDTEEEEFEEDSDYIYD